MDIEQKLSRLLPHWVEHNNAHALSYKDWAEQATKAGFLEVAEGIEEAVAAVEKANVALESALAKLSDRTS